ncbi:MAG: glycosyltransferase family 39 protein, partial [Acidobacteria bacterium]|nr:glycosyltransferase family 39 protein [Acidobacteriota bacterium]
MTPTTSSFFRSNPLAPAWIVAGVKLLVHLGALLWGGYGIFRDELYYLACADHLAWGYVDHPPLSIFLLWLNRALLGDSLFALRLVPALASCAVVLLVGALAREMGGGRLAVGLAAVGSAVALHPLAVASIWSMNVFDLLLVALAFLLLARLLRTGDSRYWIPLGIVLGLALLNKVGTLWIGLGVAAGIVFSRERRWLATRWPWLAGGLSFLLFLPYILWNAGHGWAHLEFIGRAVATKYAGLSPWTFLTDLFLGQNPVTLPFWLGGLGWLLFHPKARTFRPLGLVWLTSFLVLLANGHSKGVYLAPAFASLFAAGGVAWASLLRGRRTWTVIAFALLLSGLALAPVATPLLPVPAFVRYAEALGIEPGTDEDKELAELPQFFADRFGWKEKAEAVAKVAAGLSPEERSKAVVTR